MASNFATSVSFVSRNESQINLSCHSSAPNGCSFADKAKEGLQKERGRLKCCTAELKGTALTCHLPGFAEDSSSDAKS